MGGSNFWLDIVRKRGVEMLRAISWKLGGQENVSLLWLRFCERLWRPRFDGEKG